MIISILLLFVTINCFLLLFITIFWFIFRLIVISIRFIVLGVVDMLDFERLMIPIIPTHVCNLDNRYWFNGDIRDYGVPSATRHVS